MNQQQEGCGFLYSGKVAGEDFPLMVMVPEDDPKAARFLFPRAGDEASSSLSVEEVLKYLDTDHSEDIKDVLRQCLWRLKDLCRENGWQDAKAFYLRGLIPRIPLPEQRAALFLDLGCEMEKERNFAAAAEAYRQAVSLQPAEPTLRYFAHNNLGYSLNQLGCHAEAEPLCREAIRVDEHRHNAYKNLGVALEGLGNPKEAAFCFAQAAERAPGDLRSANHLRVLLCRHPEVLEQRRELEDRMMKIYGSMWWSISSS